MNKKTITVLSLVILLMVAACGGGGNESSSESPASKYTEKEETPSATDYDPTRGEGKYDETNVTAGALDAAMAAKGKSISETKCFSCHKITDERLVGPGWKGVTERRTLHWLMNFVTNPDPMIDKDPEVQAQLELCLVRMPNQNLTDDDARSIVEFMRENDGVK